MKSRENEEVISTAQADAGQTDPRQRLDVDGTSLTEIWDAEMTETGLQDGSDGCTRLRRRRTALTEIWDAARTETARHDGDGQAQKKTSRRESCLSGTSTNAAATYSPTWWGSTIGARGLNFSVRYG